MTYTIQGLIGKTDVLTRSSITGANLVGLPQGFTLLPFTKAFLKIYALPWLPLTDGGVLELSGTLLVMCINTSVSGQLAYVEAEFFGGAGTQASACFDQGVLIGEPLVNTRAINIALANLGVARGSALDEFEALALGRYRATDAWVQTRSMSPDASRQRPYLRVTVSELHTALRRRKYLWRPAPARAGASLPYVQRQTGHRSIKMLTVYIREAELFFDYASSYHL